MQDHIINAFCWSNVNEQNGGNQTDATHYQTIVNWAAQARGQNPNAFDLLTEWILDDAAWRDEKLGKNERIYRSILARFREQNARLRNDLNGLEPSGVVNEAVFGALDRFDEALSGYSCDPDIREAVNRVFSDFSVMKERGVREKIAGNKTGPFGTKGVAFVGYINYLKDCDAGVQWALFMPDVVRKQQKGFKVESFAYKKMPAMRFIGQECDDLADVTARINLFRSLDALDAYQSAFPYDILLMHHYGISTDVGPWHGFWGRFMRADTPAPEGFLSFDFVPSDDGSEGPPFYSQFAVATFSGDMDAAHKREGYDSDAMYDVTRNIILSQGVNIPYPAKYWTAEVFPDGCAKPGAAYLFSVAL